MKRGGRGEGGGGGGRGGGGGEAGSAFVPTSDCRFNCHGMIYVRKINCYKLSVVGAPCARWRPYF